ncbi:MAG: hypothetical protein ACFE9C_07245 [Candidatus Hodarchaeota archaeon]
MINKKFKENWLKILDFNRNRDILQDPESIKEYFRIPLSPISINANLLYKFFEILYPRFINDQNNILDIIISDEDKKNKVQSLYLYKTKNPGIHETIESLPKDTIRIKSLENINLDELFDKVQKALAKEYNVRVSSIRLFKKEAIDLINKHCERIEEISNYEFLELFTNFIQKIIRQELFLIYPEPIIFNFLRNCFTLLDKIQLRSIFKILEDILPEFNLSFLINETGVKTIIHLQKQKSKFGKSNLIIEFLTPEDLGINLNNSDIKNNLNLIQKKLNTEKAYHIHQNDIISIVSDFLELLVPLKKKNLLFLLQKVLFGYRSFDNHWDMVPRPKIYNTLIRFLFRLFGFNLNLKKISHWAIPSLIFNYLDFFIGLNSRVLFIIINQEKIKNGKEPRNNISKDSCDHIFLLEFEESILKSICPIDKKVLFSNKSHSLHSIKEHASNKIGYISSIFVFDKFLLQNIVRSFILRHSKFSIFPRYKTIKMFKNEKFFQIHPEYPFHTLIKKRRTITLVKLFLPILIDKYEF